MIWFRPSRQLLVDCLLPQDLMPFDQRGEGEKWKGESERLDGDGDIWTDLIQPGLRQCGIVLSPSAINKK